MQPHPRRRPAAFQPRFTLTLVYLFVFLFAWCALLIAPAMLDVLRSVPPGPEQQQIAERVARETLAPRLPLAFGAALLTTAVGAWRRVLPGLRGPL